MKVLFVGYTAIWDAMAVARGYLAEPDYDYDVCHRDKAGCALVVGRDEQGREVYVLGSSRPALVKKVVAELIKMGYPWADEVEVIALSLPGQAVMRWLEGMANWPLVGGVMRRLALIWARGRYPLWWEEGRKIRLRLNQLESSPGLRHN